MPNTNAAGEAVPYVYVLVREDLTAEQQVVQASHATLSAGARFGPISELTHLVVLQVKSEEALLLASGELTACGLPHHVFFEPDGGVGYSALATAPLMHREQQRVFRRYPLLRVAGSHAA